MPAPLTTALLALAFIVVLAGGPIGGIVIGALAAAIEVVAFIDAGRQ